MKDDKEEKLRHPLYLVRDALNSGQSPEALKTAASIRNVLLAKLTESFNSVEMTDNIIVAQQPTVNMQYRAVLIRPLGNVEA
jgi:hypothetical protein